MKVYIIKDSDIEELRAKLKRDTRQIHGNTNVPLTREAQSIVDTAHRFYNYEIEGWILTNVIRGDR